MVQRANISFPALWVSVIIGICTVSHDALGVEGSFSPAVSQGIQREWITARSKVAREAGMCAVEVRSLPDGRPLFSDNAHVPLVPASLTKVFTSLAALKKLGPSYTFRTEIRGPKIQQGVVPGNLLIFSNGNPLWFSKDVKSCVEEFAALHNLRAVQGGVVVDQRFFLPSVEQLCLDTGKCGKSYDPLVSPVAVDFNTLTLTVYPGTKVGEKPRISWGGGPFPLPVTLLAKTVSAKQRTTLSFHLTAASGEVRGVLKGQISLRDAEGTTLAVKIFDPSSLIATAVRSILVNRRVSVGSSSTTVHNAETLYTCKTPTLSEVLHGINRHSNNFMAEMLFRSLGGEVMGAPATREKATQAVSSVLREIGVPPQEFSLDSGSGLSYTTKASAAAFGTALTYLYRNPSIQVPFMASLAENGRDGTLRRHWAGEKFRVKGKTGTLAHALGFSGYVFWDDTAPPLVVTFICNDVSQIWKVRQSMDDFVRKIVTVVRSSQH